MNWIELYRPKTFAEIKGNKEEIRKVVAFINNPLRKKKALILYGPPGCGKTTLAHVISKETNSEIFELNASDFRNKAKLQEVLRPAMQQKSLLNSNKIILIDEADGITGTDRGGASEILNLLNLTPYPVIITANDIWSKKLSDLRKKSELINIKEADYNLITELLIDILRKEEKFIPIDILKKISVRAKGDFRAAINDLQTAAGLENPETIDFAERDKEKDIFNALKLVFKGKPTYETLRAYDAVDMPIDEIILWVEENIPSEYKRTALKKAYDALSKTDVFKGRIHKQQYWRFLIYENILLSYGISAAKESISTGYTQYQKPKRILKIWLNNQKTIQKKSIAKKYAEKTHIGEKRAMQDFLIIKEIIKSNKDIQNELKLSDEEISYILK